MSQAEDPTLLRKEQAHEVSVEDVRRLMGASTPHFALQLRNRIARLIADLPRRSSGASGRRARDRPPGAPGLRGRDPRRGGGHGRAPDAFAQRAQRRLITAPRITPDMHIRCSASGVPQRRLTTRVRASTKAGAQQFEQDREHRRIDRQQPHVQQARHGRERGQAERDRANSTTTGSSARISVCER